MQNLKQYDLVVIGGGPAGTPVAIEYAKLNPNKKIALIELSGKLGGECLFQGCIPSKIMKASAETIATLREMETFGIELQEQHYKIAWEKIVQRKEAILSKRTNAAGDIIDTLINIDFIEAEASFSSEKTILLKQNDEVTEIEFQKAVIGTGSRSFIPVYDGNGVDKIWTNNDFFAKMELPSSLAIIGTGAIAIEFAMILSEFGVKISLFGRGNSILHNIEAEAREYILSRLEENKNINLYLNSALLRVDYNDDTFTIKYKKDEEIAVLEAQRVLSAAGRVANLEYLNLEKAGIAYSKKGIVTTDTLVTTNQNVYANGDVVEGFAKFAHTAQYGAHTIAQNLFLEHNIFKIKNEINSWVLFTTPNVMMAGITEEEAAAKGIEIISDSFYFETEAKSQIENEDYGYLKFVVQKSNNQIIGISAMHQEAHILGGEAALIVANKLTLKDIIDSIHPHPTISEGYVFLAKQMMGKIMQEKLKKPLVQALLTIERWL